MSLDAEEGVQSSGRLAMRRCLRWRRLILRFSFRLSTTAGSSNFSRSWRHWIHLSAHSFYDASPNSKSKFFACSIVKLPRYRFCRSRRMRRQISFSSCLSSLRSRSFSISPTIWYSSGDGSIAPSLLSNVFSGGDRRPFLASIFLSISSLSSDQKVDSDEDCDGSISFIASVLSPFFILLSFPFSRGRSFLISSSPRRLSSYRNS